MVVLIVAGIFLSLVSLVIVTRILMGDDGETRELKTRLRFYGVEPRLFSNRCLTELIEIGMREHRLAVSPTQKELKQAVDMIARKVRDFLYGNKFHAAGDIAAAAALGKPDPFWVVLASHDPLRFDLERIETTQTAYQRRDSIG